MSCVFKPIAFPTIIFKLECSVKVYSKHFDNDIPIKGYF